MSDLFKYTVIGIEREGGQIISHFVRAESSSEAFKIVAKVSDLDMVAAIDGFINEGAGIDFAGTAVVDSETILEQDDVFQGVDVSDFYIDDDCNPDEYWLKKAAGEKEIYSAYDASQAELAYFMAGGRKQ